MTDNIDKKVEKLFEAGAHIGHKTNRIHPKARKYIYTIENNISVIDLAQTVKLLEKAKDFVRKLAQDGKTLLVVVTKKTSSNLTQEMCKKSSIPYVVVKWPAGLLTNFDMIIKNVKKLKEMKKGRENGEWNKFVKHEQVKLNKELNKLEKFYGGLINLEKIPDALFTIDIKKEKNAVKESREVHIPVVAVVDTNVNPDLVSYPIPANDDSIASIEYFVKEIVETYNKDKGNKPL